MIYYSDQNGLAIRLLQTSDYKRYKLSSFKSDEGKIKSIMNFPFFATSFVVGRYQGDVFNDTVDQTNFKGKNIVIFKDNTYKIGDFNSWDYQNIDDIAGGFCPSAVMEKGKELEISDTILEQKQFSMTAKVNRTALVYDGEYHFVAGESVNVNSFISAIQKKYPNYEFIALGDGGGSSELIINGAIQNKLADGSERPNYCGIAFVEIEKNTDNKNTTSKKLFAPRLSKDGMFNNKYWYDKDWNAGANNGAYGDSALSNCVTYASGRFSELNGQNLRNIMKNRTGFSNAKDWYNETKFDKGSTPKVGAIACFDGSLGHVAIVEKINDDGTVLVSQSNYEKIKNNYNSPNYFQTRTYKLEVGKVASGVGLVFQGYIYPPNVKYGVTRDKNKNQVEILVENLRVRLSANGEWNKGIFAPLGIYDILETKIDGDYTWAKLDDDMWVALNDNDGWTTTYLKNTSDDDNKIIDELQLKIQAQQEEIDNLYEKLIESEKALETAQNELTVASEKLDKIKSIVN